METKRVILVRFVDFDIIPNKRVTVATECQNFLKILRKSILAIIFHNFTCSTIFLVNNGHMKHG